MLLGWPPLMAQPRPPGLLVAAQEVGVRSARLDDAEATSIGEPRFARE